MSAADAVVVRARGLREEYGRGDGLVRALDSVDLDVRRGEAVAVTRARAAAASRRCCT